MLMTLAILLKSLIPAGYMPDQDKPFQMVICTLNGPQTILLNKDMSPYQGDNPHQNKPDKAVDDLCAFAFHTALNTAPPVMAIPAPYVTLLSQTAVTIPQTITPLRFFGNASSRAPPVISYV